MLRTAALCLLLLGTCASEAAAEWHFVPMAGMTMFGSTSMVSAVAESRPPRMTMAISVCSSLPGSQPPSASGMRASLAVSSVIRIGDSRSSEPCTTASRVAGAPWDARRAFRAREIRLPARAARRAGRSFHELRLRRARRSRAVDARVNHDPQADARCRCGRGRDVGSPQQPRRDRRHLAVHHSRRAHQVGSPLPEALMIPVVPH